MVGSVRWISFYRSVLLVGCADFWRV